jgi:hypothetical protein
MSDTQSHHDPLTDYAAQLRAEIARQGFRSPPDFAIKCRLPPKSVATVMLGKAKTIWSLQSVAAALGCRVRIVLEREGEVKI